MKSSVTSWPLARTRKSGRLAIESVELGTVDTTVEAHTSSLHQHWPNNIHYRNLQAVPTGLQPGLRQRTDQWRDS